MSRFFLPFLCALRRRVRHFLFKSMVTSIPLSKESGDDEGGSGTGSEGTEGVDFAVTGEEERLETVERVRKKSRTHD